MAKPSCSPPIAWKKSATWLTGCWFSNLDCLAETIDIETLRKRYLPELNLVLWIAEERRPAAVSCLLSEGFDAHTNGRGTVVVRVQEDLKMHPLQALQACQIPVLNFDIEGAAAMELSPLWTIACSGAARSAAQ